MREEFETATVEVIAFESSDVITASNDLPDQNF